MPNLTGDHGFGDLRRQANDRDRIDRDTGGAQAIVEQDPHERPTERVAHEDGWPVEAVDDLLETLDGLRDRHAFEYGLEVILDGLERVREPG
jgi:hypothetical protein